MSTYNHTSIATGAAANASTFNGPNGQLDAAIGNLATLSTTAHGSAVAAINEVFADVVAAQTDATNVAAEVGAARVGYADLDARIDAISIAGSGVSTLTNGVTNASQKIIVVDSTTGILAGALISYTLVGGVIQTNTVDTIDSPTQLTAITNVGTGGIADNTYLSMIPVGILMSSGAVVGAVQQMQDFEDGIRVHSTSGTTAKWAFKPTYATFSGNRDEIMFFGWNVNGISGTRIDASEASLYHGIEADYYVVGTGKHYSEWYIEFYDATGAINRRPFSTSIDRADGAISNQFKGEQIFYKDNGDLAWQIDTSGNLSSSNIIRFTQNDGSVLTQLNAVGNAYINLIRLNSADRVVVGDPTSTILMTATSAARVGIGGDTPDTKLHIEQADAGTNGVVGLFTLSRNSSGTAAAGFGSRILFELSDSGAYDTAAAAIDASWHVATNGAVEGDLTLYAYGTGQCEGVRVRGNGSTPEIGFFAATPVAKPTGVAVSAGGIHAALVSLGLIAA